MAPPLSKLDAVLEKQHMQPSVSTPGTAYNSADPAAVHTPTYVAPLAMTASEPSDLASANANNAMDELTHAETLLGIETVGETTDMVLPALDLNRMVQRKIGGISGGLGTIGTQ